MNANIAPQTNHPSNHLTKTPTLVGTFVNLFPFYAESLSQIPSLVNYAHQPTIIARPFYFIQEHHREMHEARCMAHWAVPHVSG